MNLSVINSTSSVSTTKRKREAERSVNWTAEETQVLLCAWSDERVQKSLAENLRNRHVFKHLSTRMSEMGFSRSPHQCRLRVKTLKANYVRAKLQRSVDCSQPCTFKYFADMDAVLGRRSAGMDRGNCFVSLERMRERHFDSSERTESILPDLHFNSEFLGHRYASLGSTERQLLSSLEEGRGHSEVKLENGEDSADDFEISNAGFPLHRTNKSLEIDQESSIHPEISGTLENSLSAPSPLVNPPPTAPSPPPPTVPSRPPLSKSTPSSLPAPADPVPITLPTSGHCRTDSSCLEPVLKHMSECFQQLVSDTRGLLVQLEKQRQEQARWHQELLTQWLQREECRRREMAEREERREKARMEHEIRVLELLTSLAREQRCKCGGSQQAEAPTGSSHTMN